MQPNFIANSKQVKNVDRYNIGAGCIGAFADLLRSKREVANSNGLSSGVIFLIDSYFESKANLLDPLGFLDGDIVKFISSAQEPTTDGIDALLHEFTKKGMNNPLAVVGFGGGVVMDTSKAVSNLLTNGGKASDYQGWDLVRVPGIYKIGIPTISGTGAEATRTCVMTNKDTGLKLGMNSDFTVFDHIFLDPELSASVPRDQYFYTGMDAYMALKMVLLRPLTGFRTLKISLITKRLFIMSNKRAVILAGGKGTRLHPFTITMPKPLVPIGDYPILEIIIKQLSEAGFNHITLAVNHQAEIIKAFFGDGKKWNIHIDYSLETEALGTMGPLTLIGDLPEHVLVMNGDILTNLDYRSFFEKHVENNEIFTISSYNRTELIDYGVLETQDEKLCGFKEKPSFNYEVSMGIYMVSSTAIRFIPKNKPYGFDELMLTLLNNGKRVSVSRFGGYWLDIGRPSDYAKAQNEFGLANLKLLK